MIYESIPDSVNTAGYLFLFFVGVFLPFVIVRSARRLGDRPLPLSRMRFFVQTVLLQIMLFALAAMTARSHGIDNVTRPQRPLLSWVVALLFFVLTTGTLKWRWRDRPLASRQRLYDILPHDRRELLPYTGVCIAAGIAEEVVYRGVMVVLLQRLLGSTVLSVLIASAVFGVSHMMQGWRSAGAIFIIAIGCHALVFLSQSLLPIMVVHFAYDLCAGVLIPRWFERDQRLAEVAPAPA